MKRTPFAVVMLAACLAVVHAQQPAPQPPLRERIAALMAKGGYSGTERPLSASVLGSFVSWQPGDIGLIVLWRGADRWYYASPRSGGGGGSAAGFQSANQFGSIRIDLRLNQTRRTAQVNNVEVSLSDGQNVLLVDGADENARLSVRAIRADLSYTATQTDASTLPLSDLAAIFRRSSEMMSFLQCDTPANAAPARVTGYICEDLRAK